MKSDKIGPLSRWEIGTCCLSSLYTVTSVLALYLTPIHIYDLRKHHLIFKVLQLIATTDIIALFRTPKTEMIISDHFVPWCASNTWTYQVELVCHPSEYMVIDFNF